MNHGFKVTNKWYKEIVVIRTEKFIVSITYDEENNNIENLLHRMSNNLLKGKNIREVAHDVKIKSVGALNINKHTNTK